MYESVSADMSVFSDDDSVSTAMPEGISAYISTSGTGAGAGSTSAPYAFKFDVPHPPTRAYQHQHHNAPATTAAGAVGVVDFRRLNSKGSNALVIDDDCVESDEDQGGYSFPQIHTQSISQSPPHRSEAFAPPEAEVTELRNPLAPMQSAPALQSVPPALSPPIVENDATVYTADVAPIYPASGIQRVQTPYNFSYQRHHAVRDVHNMQSQSFEKQIRQIYSFDAGMQSATEKSSISVGLRPASKKDIEEHNIFKVALKRQDERSRQSAEVQPATHLKPAVNTRDVLLKKKVKRDIIGAYDALGVDASELLTAEEFSFLLNQLGIQLTFSPQLLMESYALAVSLGYQSPEVNEEISGATFKGCLEFMYLILGVGNIALNENGKQLIDEVQKCRFTSQVG
jgi:hypothetical protein